MKGKIKIEISKDRPGSLRPLCPKGSKQVGNLMLSSDPETGDIAFAVLEPGKTKTATEMAQEVENEVKRLRREAWTVIVEEPGIGVIDLRKAVTGRNSLIEEATDWLVDGGYVERKKVGRAVEHWPINPDNVTPEDF